jgi:hypothetical protein
VSIALARARRRRRHPRDDVPAADEPPRSLWGGLQPFTSDDVYMGWRAKIDELVESTGTDGIFEVVIEPGS